MKIKTRALTKEDFYRAFVSKTHAIESFDKNRAFLGISFDTDRNYFVGQISEDSLEIWRPSRITGRGITQRIFSGTYMEMGDRVVVEGSFRFANLIFFGHVIAGIITSFVFFLLSLAVLLRWFPENILTILAALAIGVGVGGYFPFAFSRILTITCEKDVIKFLSSLK